MNHRIGRLLFAFAVGLIVAFLAYRWVTSPAPRIERQQEEAAVLAARSQLQQTLSLQDLELVDPLAQDRTVGKAYVYRAANGWEVSGYYRRDDSDSWHPYLLVLDDAHGLVRLKIRDSEFKTLARTDARLEVAE